MADVAKKTADSPSARFTSMMIREYQVTTGKQEVSPVLARRMQNWFIKIDMILNDAETKRLSKQQNREPLEFTWKNVNIEKLALDCMIYSALELDPLTPNHVTPIPYKNSRTNKYDMTFIKGYRGLEVIAKKFGLDAPLDVVVQLVHETDTFEIINKDQQNEIESYHFKINNPFKGRGEVIGGFFYMIYEDPRLNRIEIMDVAEIEKRKPKYASAEFWGGEKKDFKTGKVEVIDGWKKEMYIKTLLRKAYNSVTIDGSKIDDLYTKMISSEAKAENELELTETIDGKAEVVEEIKPIEIQEAKEVETIGFQVTTHEVVTIEAEKQEPTQEAEVVFEFPEME